MNIRKEISRRSFRKAETDGQAWFLDERRVTSSNYEDTVQFSAEEYAYTQHCNLTVHILP